MRLQRLSSKTNCPNDNQDSGKHKCDHGTDVRLVTDSRICANIALDDHGNSTGCGLNGPNDVRRLFKGDCIEWRYITNDGGKRQDQWVMGQLRFRRENVEASWVFIRRTALDARTSKLPSIASPRDQSCNA